MIDIKQKINEPSYDFLRQNSDLKDVIYLTLSGSYAYGTNNEKSDTDLRGVLVEQPRYLYGLQNFEQFEDRETDTVIFGLKKFMALCINANPSALELLGTREDNIAYMSDAGRLLREHVGLFLSRRVIHSFGSYAEAQLRRLCNALCHDAYDAAEQEQHLAQVLDGQMEHFNRTYAPVGENMKIYLSDETEPKLLLDVKLTGYPLRDFSGIHAEIGNIIKTYGKMNHRNRKKDDMHLYKHAMHLIRLLIAGEDILRGNGIITFREKEHSQLMGIRNGMYSFEEVLEMADNHQNSFRQAAKETRLPEQPDIHAVEVLMSEIYRSVLSNGGVLSTIFPSITFDERKTKVPSSSITLSCE